MYFQLRNSPYCVFCKKILSEILYFVLVPLGTEIETKPPSALRSSRVDTGILFKNYSVDFNLPDQDIQSKIVPRTESYGEVPGKKLNIRDNVSDMRYVLTSTPEATNKRKRETFEDVCDGTYIYYQCIL